MLALRLTTPVNINPTLSKRFVLGKNTHSHIVPYCSVDDNPLHTTSQLSTHLDIAGRPNPVVVLLPE